MTDHDDLEQRLRRLGREPIDPGIAGAHLAALAAAQGPDAAARRWRFSWRAVAAAAVVGFLAGGTGLAAAGTLPDPAQDVAHDVLGAVGIDVPRSTDGCPAGRSYRNHGEYVSEVEAAGGDVEAAARSDCGKPVRGGGNDGGPGGGQPRPDTDGDPCTGPPPWAGAHLPRSERDALQEARQAQCREAEAQEADETEEVPPAGSEPETTTTVPAETTTTVPASTSTSAPEASTTTVTN